MKTKIADSIHDLMKKCHAAWQAVGWRKAADMTVYCECANTGPTFILIDGYPLSVNVSSDPARDLRTDIASRGQPREQAVYSRDDNDTFFVMYQGKELPVSFPASVIAEAAMAVTA